jgi:GTP cyclohydrolase I
MCRHFRSLEAIENVSHEGVAPREWRGSKSHGWLFQHPARRQKTEGPNLIEEIRKILEEIGEDTDRDGLLKTPERVEESLRYLTSGYGQSAEKLLNNALFEVPYDEMVIVKDIEIFSLCEHHLLPFFGKCHVAYLPDASVVGLSKIPRLVDMFARRLQVQERLTMQIAETINEKVQPRGVAVVIEAQHLCMIMRGVEKQHSVATTSSMLGAFKDDQNTRNEFLNLIHRNGNR